MRGFFRKITSALLAVVIMFGVVACNPAKSDADLVKDALASITLPAEVTSDITLPTLNAQFAGVELTFSSSNASALSNAGVVTRSVTEDVTVTFTVTAKKGDAEDFRNFEIKVLKREVTDAEKVAIAIDALTLAGIDGLVDNLSLPASGEAGTVISWATSDATVITEAGVIIPNPYGGTSKTATLTATVTLGSASDTKDFEITVLPRGFDTLNVTKTISEYSIIESEGGAFLVIKGTAYLDQASPTREFSIRIGGESAQKLPAKTSNGATFEFEVELTDALIPVESGKSAWLDINMFVKEINVAEQQSEKKFEVTGTSALEQKAIKVGDYRYSFQSYETGGTHYLKIQRYADPTVTERTNANTYFAEERVGNTDKVYLIIEGQAYFENSGTVSRTIGVKFVEHENVVVIDDNISNIADVSDTRNFKFKIDVTNAPMKSESDESEWLDIILTVSEGGMYTENDIQQGQINFLVPGATAFSASEGVRFRFQQWNHLLKLYAQESNSRYVTMNEFNDESIYIKEAEGKAYLVVEGTAFVNGGATDRTISLRIDKDNMSNNVQAAISNAYSGSGDNTHFYFELDLSGLENSGAWYEPVLVITEDATPTPTMLYVSGITTGKTYRAGDKAYEMRDGGDNIKFTVADRTGLIKAEFAERGDGTYIILEGYIGSDWTATSRMIKSIRYGYDGDVLDLSKTETTIDGATNLYTGDDNSRYLFEIKVSDINGLSDWKLLGIVIEEDGTDKVIVKIDNVWRDEEGKGAAYLDSDSYTFVFFWNHVYLRNR